jgi:pilus assembly protein CpaF
MIIQIERHRDGTRRVTQVTDVCGIEGEVVILNDIALFEIEAETADGRLLGKYKINRSRPSFHHRLSYFGLDRAWLQALEGVE